jgi:hypothetical protein
MLHPRGGTLSPYAQNQCNMPISCLSWSLAGNIDVCS